jgi:hypothetical protein
MSASRRASRRREVPPRCIESAGGVARDMEFADTSERSRAAGRSSRASTCGCPLPESV